jgi:hypothetical protein
MKKLLLTIAALGALTFTAAAQNAGKSATASQQPALTAEQKAEKETTKATGALSLTDAQKATFKKLALERFTANMPLREKAKASTDKAEKQTLRSQIVANNDKFFTSVNAMLTPEQQTKWADHRKKMQEKQKNAEHQD